MDEPTKQNNNHPPTALTVPTATSAASEPPRTPNASWAPANPEQAPAGGFDATPIPHAPPGYTLKFTFHRAVNLPLGDLNTLSSDPYILAILTTDLPRRHKQEPDLTFRSPTIRRSANPDWECSWVVANVPASGFHLKCRIYDSDRADHDDRLGSAYVDVEAITEDWDGIPETEYKVRKRLTSMRAYVLRFVVSNFSKEVGRRGALFVSVEVLGKTPGDDGGQMYTVGPNYWRQHFSPLIGRLVGAKDSVRDGQKRVDRYNFQAIEMQLRGPVPPQLYHRYVEFRPFVEGMFKKETIRGRFLHHALRHQHARIYNHSRLTQYGEFESPTIDFTKQFLDFVGYDLGGKIFTYVITLDGQWRFTETGKEFGIDLLSKHTMHSDVSVYIAYSGEFLVRRVDHDYHHHHHHHRRHPSQSGSSVVQHNSDQVPLAVRRHSQPSSLCEETTLEPPTDPTLYELYIDNDSGTYRPNADLLPILKDFLSSNLPGLTIKTLDCQKDEIHMSALKEEQRERKKAGGRPVAFMQRRSGSFSSISSSEEEDLDDLAGDTPVAHPNRRKVKDYMDVKTRFRRWRAGPAS